MASQTMVERWYDYPQEELWLLFLEYKSYY